MLLVLLLGFGAIVVDVGFYLHRRERVQHITDAAALAGAQELPEDTALAETIAREWADRNGLDGSSIDISFECRADNPLHCKPSDYDTIIVEGSLRAPVTLMPVLRLLGGSSDSCWLNEGCDVAGTAAACRGECTTAVTPVDAVLVLDRTISMSDGDMDKAKEGARAMLEQLNPELQSVGLGVLPPSISQSLSDEVRVWIDGRWRWVPEACWPDTSEPWSLNDHWLVVNLSDDYKPAVDEPLDPWSRLVRVLDCLQSGGWTNIAYPIQIAREHLLFSSEARDDAQKAIVLLSDGAPNRPSGQNPCELANAEATAAKDAGIEIYVIGYGVNDPGPGQECEQDTGTWSDSDSEDLVYAMATDEDHVFIEPEGSDLTDVFEEIGRRLAAGSRLVE